jgi:thiol-disulfide isomerase/thioredoxin
MIKFFDRSKLLFAALLIGTALAAGAEEVKLDWLPSGATKKLAYYKPARLTLSSTKPDGLKVAPADLQAPLYGKLQLGPAESPTTFLLVIDEPDGKPARLFIDANANGDLTDDPPVEWKAVSYKARDGAELTRCTGSADLLAAYGPEKLKMRIEMYRFDKRDPQRAAFANTVFYYRDFARAGDVSLGGKTYPAMLVDDGATGDFRPPADTNKPPVMLFLDLNNDGKFEMRGESFDVAKPFNIGGTTYEITALAASGESFQIVKSSKTVEETKPRPTLAPGSMALAFEAKATDGTTINFPGRYKGKLVMLDFWATWCPPCRAEIPGLVKTYTKYHDKGFEVLGVSLDQADATEKLAKFTKDNNMPWPEIYDGKYWQAAVAQQYFIESIPHPFLVDGDTGKIMADGDALRGEKLPATIEKALGQHP